MAQNETWLNHDLMNAVKVQYLDGNLFSMDNAGNLIGVKLTRDGVDYSGGGSVSANVIRADGGTVSVVGALSGNTATIVLPQAAYAVPGVVSIVVKLTVSGQVTTIAAVVVNVYQSSTDSVIDPGTIIPSVQNLISAIQAAIASIPADYSSLWTSLAPAFDADKVGGYKAGEYVTENGAVYRFKVDHSGSWASGDVEAVNIGGELVKLRNADLDLDLRTNQMLSLVNYGYDNLIDYPIGDGSTWNKSIGVFRNGTTLQVQKTSTLSVDVRIKLSGAFDLAGNNAGVEAWTTGLSFKAEHKYQITSRLIGGSAVYGTDSHYAGKVNVDETGTYSSVGVFVYEDGVFKRTFTAESGKDYNIIFYAYADAIFTDAVYLITMEDLTESEFVNLQTQIDEIRTETQYTDVSLKSGNITSAGKAGNNNQYIRTYGGELPKVEKGDAISAGNGFEIVNAHIFRTNSVASTGHIANLTVTDANYLEIPDQYEGMYIGFTVYEPSKTGQDISGDVAIAMKSVKIAKEIPLSETINNLNSRVDALESDISVPDYYFDDDYLDGKVAEINTIGVELGVNALRTIFFTDYHYEDNARKSPDLIDYLIRKTGIRSVVFGGDAMNYDYSSKVGGYNKICTFLDDFKKVREAANIYFITGNHEMNDADLSHDSVELPKSVPYNLYNDPNYFKIKTLWAPGKATNSFYVDDDVSKIRFYGIDCTSGASIQKAYLDVILPSFLTVPEGYSVIVFSHSGVASYTTDESDPPVYTITGLTAGLDAIMQAGKAMNDGANAAVTATISGITYTWELDFTGKARTFVGSIIGHSHFDSYYIYDSRFPVILVNCDTGAYRSSHPHRVAGTITEQAFDVVQINIDTSRIYCTRIGYGSDRTFSFGEGAGIIT